MIDLPPSWVGGGRKDTNSLVANIQNNGLEFYNMERWRFGGNGVHVLLIQLVSSNSMTSLRAMFLGAVFPPLSGRQFSILTLWGLWLSETTKHYRAFLSIFYFFLWPRGR